jgi:hypothetical protein
MIRHSGRRISGGLPPRTGWDGANRLLPSNITSPVFRSMLTELLVRLWVILAASFTEGATAAARA